MSLQTQLATREINLSSLDDQSYLNETLTIQNNDEHDERKTCDDVSKVDYTVQTLIEEEEALLNLHMSVIQVCISFLIYSYSMSEF